MSENKVSPLSTTESASNFLRARQSEPSEIQNSSTQNHTHSEMTSPGDSISVEDERLDEYNCPICIDLLIEPAVTNCGHRFCTFCLANWFHQRGRKDCPSCRTFITQLYHLPVIADKVEELVQEKYTVAQKDEREEVKRSRATSQIIERLGPNPLETLISQSLNNNFEFELPLFDFSDDELESGISFFDPDIQQVVNLAATAAQYPGEGYRFANGEWINAFLEGFTGPSSSPQAPTIQTTDTQFMEIEALLNDFEIRLRESQMAYRSLMDRLTDLDAFGIYYRRIEDRFRSLGLIAELGRLVTTFPSEPVRARENTSRHNDDNGRGHDTVPSSSLNPSRGSTPHPSDWYFIQRNRFRRNLALSDWEENFQNSIDNRVLESHYHTNTRNLEYRPDAYEYSEPSNVVMTQRRRRRRHRQRNSTNTISMPSIEFGILERPYDEYIGHTAERPYDYADAEDRFHQPQMSISQENHIVTDADNLCVVHPDGTETWIDLTHLTGQREETYNNYEAHPHAMSCRRTTSSEIELSFEDGESDGDRGSIGLELILEHSCQHSVPQGSRSRTRDDYSGDGGH